MGQNVTKNRQVRVFISSTFQDMNEERDYLVRIVFPRIKEYCHSRYLDFVPIDLRWGITEETSRTSLVLNTCFREIDDSRPFFIGILGERYGWIPTQEEIANLFENKNIDINWLRRMSAEGASVTEMEMEYAVLNNLNNSYGLFFIKNISEASSPGVVVNDSKSQYRLKKLKQKIRSQKRYPVRDYSEVEELGKYIEDELIKMIDTEFPDPELDFQQSIIAPHEQAFRRRANMAIDINTDIFDDWLKEGMKTLTIEGNSGYGVSTYISVGVEYLRKHYTNQILYFDFESVKTSEDPIDALVRYIDLHPNIEFSTDWVVFALDNTAFLDLKQSQTLVTWIYNTSDIYRFILSLTTHTPIFAEATFRLSRSQWSIYGYNEKRIALITQSTLSKHGKSITSEQLQSIKDVKAFSNPIILRLFLKALIEFGSYEGFEERLQLLLERSKYVLSLFLLIEGKNLYIKIGMGEAYFLAIFAIAANLQGISEEELLIITGLEQSQWSVVRPYILQFCKGSSIRLRLRKDSWSNDVKDAFPPRLLAKTGLEMLERLLKHNNIGKYAIILRHIFSFACPYFPHLDEESHRRGIAIGTSLATSPDCILALPDFEYTYLLSKVLMGTPIINLLLNPVLKGIKDKIGFTIGRKVGSLSHEEKVAYYTKVASKATVLSYGNMAYEAYMGLSHLYDAESPKANLNVAKALISIGRVGEARNILKENIVCVHSTSPLYMEYFIQIALTYILEMNISEGIAYINDEFPEDAIEESADLYNQVLEVVMRGAYILSCSTPENAKIAKSIVNHYHEEMRHFNLAEPAMYYRNMALTMISFQSQDTKEFEKLVNYAVECAFYCWGVASWQYGRAMLLRAYFYWNHEGDYRDRRPYLGYYPPRPYDEIIEVNPYAPKTDWSKVDIGVRKRLLFEHDVMRWFVVNCQGPKKAKEFENDDFGKTLGLM